MQLSKEGESMRFKKIFGFLMAVALVLMLLPKPVQAVATVPDGQYYIDVTLVGGSGRVCCRFTCFINC